MGSVKKFRENIDINLEPAQILKKVPLLTIFMIINFEKLKISESSPSES